MRVCTSVLSYVTTVYLLFGLQPLQVQAVTEVGAGDFSSPVMLVDSSDSSGSTAAPIIAATVSVLVLFIGALIFIAAVLSICICR